MPNERDDADAMFDQDLDQPATRRDLLALETAIRADMVAHQETMRRDLVEHQEATRRDLLALEARVDQRFAQVDQRFAQVDQRFAQVDQRFDQVDQRFNQLEGRMDDLRRHFDVVAESFRTQFGHLFDWTQTTTSTLGARVDRLEQDHQTRVAALELRAARLERRRKRR